MRARPPPTPAASRLTHDREHAPPDISMNICYELAHLFIPSCCVVCGAATGTAVSLCAGCANELPWAREACTLCAEPLAGAAPVCRRCRRRPLPLRQAIVPLRFEGRARELVHRLKFASWAGRRDRAGAHARGAGTGPGLQSGLRAVGPGGSPARRRAPARAVRALGKARASARDAGRGGPASERARNLRGARTLPGVGCDRRRRDDHRIDRRGAGRLPARSRRRCGRGVGGGPRRIRRRGWPLRARWSR